MCEGEGTLLLFSVFRTSGGESTIAFRVGEEVSASTLNEMQSKQISQWIGQGKYELIFWSSAVKRLSGRGSIAIFRFLIIALPVSKCDGMYPFAVGFQGREHSLVLPLSLSDDAAWANKVVSVTKNKAQTTYNP
jgi:hypothetical protein